MFLFKSGLISILFFKSTDGISPFISRFFEPFNSISFLSKSILLFKPGNFPSISPPIFPFKFNSWFGILLSKLRLTSGVLRFKSLSFISIFALISLVGIFKFPSGIFPSKFVFKGFILFALFKSNSALGIFPKIFGPLILVFKSIPLFILISPPFIFKSGFVIPIFDL